MFICCLIWKQFVCNVCCLWGTIRRPWQIVNFTKVLITRVCVWVGVWVGVCVSETGGTVVS